MLLLELCERSLIKSLIDVCGNRLRKMGHREDLAKTSSSCCLLVLFSSSEKTPSVERGVFELGGGNCDWGNELPMPILGMSEVRMNEMGAVV